MVIMKSAYFFNLSYRIFFSKQFFKIFKKIILFYLFFDLNHRRTSRHWYQVVVNGFLELISEKNKKSNARRKTWFLVLHPKIRVVTVAAIGRKFWVSAFSLCAVFDSLMNLFASFNFSLPFLFLSQLQKLSIFVQKSSRSL